LDFTFVCPTELIAFSDMVSEFAENNCQVVACSVDSHFSHLAWNNMPRNQGGLGGVEYPILADFSKQIAEDYGVLIGKLCSRSKLRESSDLFATKSPELQLASPLENVNESRRSTF
jgi:alkyl hydroperoxide reductase subunit AhpC